MSMSKKMWLICVATVCILSVINAGDVDIKTASGTVRGQKNAVLDGTVDTFLGIPFAEPPIGHLRFQRPVAVNEWSGIKDATKLPNSCHQTIDESFGKHSGVEMWNANTEMSEDCLYLNIWTPNASTTTKKAVLVFIYGGGFFGGTSTLDVYNGGVLASNNDVVVASMNYRLGPLGFLYFGEEDSAPGNMGLLDQQMALQWVYDNIEQFGGDKTRITIFGESAGAASVAFHMLAPLSRNLFARASLMSGSAYSYWAVYSQEMARERSTKLADKMGCNGHTLKDAKATVACLRELDAANITLEQWSVTDGYYFDPPFSAVVDGHFLVESPKTTIEKGEMKKCDILGGAVDDEGMYWLIYGIPKLFPLEITKPLTHNEFSGAVDTIIKPYITKADKMVKEAVVFQYEESIVWQALNMTLRDILDKLSGDILFTCSVFDYAHDYAKAGQNVYMYHFNQRTNNNPWPEWMGVLHGYELEFLFGWPLNDSRGYTREEKELSIQMMQYWTNFAKTGDPNRQHVSQYLSSKDYRWPKYSPSLRQYTVLEKPQQPNGYGYRHEYCTFWKDFVHKLQNRPEENTTVCGNSARRNQAYLFSLVTLLSGLMLRQ